MPCRADWLGGGHSFRISGRTGGQKYPPARVYWSWLGRLDSNQDPQIQSLVCCHCTTPQGNCAACTHSADPSLLARTASAANCNTASQRGLGTMAKAALGTRLPFYSLGGLGVNPSLRASSYESASGSEGASVLWAEALSQKESRSSDLTAWPLASGSKSSILTGRLLATGVTGWAGGTSSSVASASLSD